MEQAIGPAHRATDGVRVGDVPGPLIHADRAELSVRMADERDDIVPLRAQLARERASDESGRAGDEVAQVRA